MRQYVADSHIRNGRLELENVPFSDDVKMRKAAKVITILTMLVLMFAGVSAAGIPAAERDALTEMCNSADGANRSQHREISFFFKSVIKELYDEK